MSERAESTPGWERWPVAGTTDEHRRLLLMEQAYDKLTIGHLERTGVAEGWRCLEVGAGAGSIAGWLAHRAGATNVTATELYPDYLSGLADLGVRVLRHDVAAEEAPGDEFDLIHARLVLEHIRTRDQVVERLASWLAPGGWLVLEDASYVPQIAARPALRRLEEAWVRMAAGTMGSDVDWARTFPLPLERAGLTATSAELSMPALRGGTPLAAAIALGVRLGAGALLAGGTITAAELDEVYHLCADPSLVDYSFQAIVAWGRRPAAR
jgi:SAM-dependent methyltransferase